IFLPSKKLHWLARIIAWSVILTGGQWLKIKGDAPLKENGPYLYLFNHQSIFDAFMIVASARHYFTGVGAIEQFSYPVWGFLAKKYGLIPIERKKIGSAIGSLAEVENALNNGVSAMIAPEGTRTLTGNLGPFKKGAFHVAKNTGITIIPVALIGAFEAKNKNDWRVKPGILSTIFGDPITQKEYDDISVADLRDLVRSRMSELMNN
ncbi:MAG: lysophospholipid acyltransferase family protein, partial [SAR202 cluster bacterium]|nr:lysophospholipid acyltransferase family protein [SAR202 cluster bacterium]